MGTYLLATVALQFTAYFVLVVSLQYIGGAFQDDFGGASDEPSHYVTALMVRNYIAAGLPHQPMRFAEDFYLHYPKMAMGHWPPAAYVLFAIWMLIFGAGRTSVLLLLALLNAACALLLFRAARGVLSLLAAQLIAIAFLLLPQVQSHAAMVMLEVLLTLVSFGAVLAFDRWLHRDTWANAGWFGLLAATSILTKGNGWVLLLVPLISLVLLRDLRRMLSPRLFFALAIIALTCVPFTLWSMHMVKDGWDADTWTLQFTVRAIPNISRFMLDTVGVVLALCALVGVWTKVIVPFWNRSIENFWAVMAGYIGGVWLFHVMVPTSLEPRKILMAVPALLLFAGAGIDSIAEALPAGIGLQKRQALVGAGIALGFLLLTFQIPRAYCSGFVRAVQFLRAKPELNDVGFFVSSASDGEGRFIAEVANLETLPQHVVIRATKALAKTNWLMTKYQLRDSSPAEVGDLLNGYGVAVVVLHSDAPQGGPIHHQLVSALLKGSHEWQRIYSDYPHCSRHNSSEEIAIYSYRPDPTRKLRHVEVDLENKLGRTLQR
jgi:hypothetical protein